MVQRSDPTPWSLSAPDAASLSKQSGIYARVDEPEGGWGFVLPSVTGEFFVVPARDQGLIGSGSDATVRIPGEGVSAHHARVEVRADGVYLEDLQSKGGTYVGGVQARRIDVADGDIVRFGKQLAIFAERSLSSYEGRAKLDDPFIAGPHVHSRLVAPACALAKEGRSFCIEGGPGTGKATLARRVAEQVRSKNLTIVEGGSDQRVPLRDVESTWLILGADKVPRSIQVEIAQHLSRMSPGSMAIATSTHLDRGVAEGAIAPIFAALFHQRKLTIPPLSRRREDIVSLVMGLVRRHGLDASRISVELLEQLARAGWPGGVPELLSVLLEAMEVQDERQQRVAVAQRLSRPPAARPSLPTSDDPSLARARLADALSKGNGSIASAARSLGMSRQAVYREAQRLGLQVGKRRTRE